MTSRGLLVAWAAVIVAFLVLLGYELAQWRAISTEGARAAGERQRLASEIGRREEQLVAEMRAHSALLREMQWTSAGGDPSAFLARLAELAQEKRMKVMAIGPLERQSTPQFDKSWHAIQVVAPYREIRELAARVEREKGILEDVRVGPAPAPPAGAPKGAGPDEVQARFRMTALELAAPAKRILERALAADVGSPGGPALPASRPMPPPAPAGAERPLGRDPFAFVAGTGPVPKGRSEAPRPGKPPAPMELSAVVSFPGGYLAIVNNQIVKVGDSVSGHRVERITDNAVSLREPGAAPRTIQLPELGATPPAPPRR